MTELTMQYDSASNTWSYKEQPQMQVEVVLASAPKRSPYHKALYTVRLRYPRPIHGEIMTHRKFGRNARSSRAVPVKTMLNEVRTIPYVPWHWGLNQSGMQADQECDARVNLSRDWPIKREEAWLYARDSAVRAAEAFMNAGYHKQNPNRLLEPFSWIDTLITSSDWDNFLWLREHGAAEPHLQDLAKLVHTALVNAEVQNLAYDEWHMPYITQDDWAAAYKYAKQGHIVWSETSTWELEQILLKISAARCARISYIPFDGNPSYEREIERYNMLVSSDRVHASPTEHQARPDRATELDGDGDPIWTAPKYHGNLTGYIQYRKIIPNECYTGRII